MPTCPNCGSRKILWGQEREQSVPQQTQENEQIRNNDLVLNGNELTIDTQTPTNIILVPDVPPSDVEIRGADKIMTISTDGLSITEASDTSDVIAALAICQDCGSV